MEIKAKINEKFDGGFLKRKKKKRTKTSKVSNAVKLEPMKENHFQIEADISPPDEENERLSKREEESSSDTPSKGSSDVDLPSYDVPELFSDEEFEDTQEMQDAARRAMQGSFLPIMAILETQICEDVNPNTTIDQD